jgi:hypothetical protein
MRFLGGLPVDCDDPELLAAAMWELEDRLHADRSAGDSHLPELSRLERAVEVARARLMGALKGESQEEVRAVARHEYERFTLVMAEREQALEARLREQMLELRDRQERECAEHDARWTIEPRQRMFNRSSQRLRILKLQRQLLSTAHRFNDALQVSGAGNAQGGETGENTQMQDGFEGSRMLLGQKHEEESSRLLQTMEMKRAEFQYIRDTLAKRFAHQSIGTTPEQGSSSPEGVWVRTRRTDGAIAPAPGSSPRRRAMLATADASANSLPPLDMDSPARKRK